MNPVRDRKNDAVAGAPAGKGGIVAQECRMGHDFDPAGLWWSSNGAGIGYNDGLKNARGQNVQ